MNPTKKKEELKPSETEYFLVPEGSLDLRPFHFFGVSRREECGSETMSQCRDGPR